MAFYDPGWWLTPDTTTTYFAFQDHLGSTRIVTDDSGAIVDSIEYGPYGEIISGGTTTSHTFTGKEFDSESGLYNFLARYYSPAQGRFMSPDPHAGDIGDPQTLNRYAYVRNNPLTLTDPTGMDASGGDEGISIFFGECLVFCDVTGGGVGHQPPIDAPPDPGNNPNPGAGAGDTDPNGPFSGPIWQEGGPQIAPTGNLAALLGLQMPSPFIINNILSHDQNGNIVSDTYGEELSVLINNVWTSRFWGGSSWVDADTLYLQQLATQIQNDGANDHFIFGVWAASLGLGAAPAAAAAGVNVMANSFYWLALNPETAAFGTDLLEGTLSPTPGPFSVPGLLGNILPNIYGDNTQ